MAVRDNRLIESANSRVAVRFGLLSLGSQLFATPNVPRSVRSVQLVAHPDVVPLASSGPP